MAQTLSGFQRKYLRGLAHSLKPIVWVGQKGATAFLVQALDEALNTHELVKIKFNENKNKAEKERITHELQKATQAQLVGTIGHIAILYRPHPEKDKRQIVLP